MRKITLENFHQELRAQGVKSHLDFAFVCPMCRTVQSARDLIAAGAGADFEAVEGLIGFACVGRFTGAGPHKKDAPPGRGCDWTLGGLLRMHDLEIIMPDGPPRAAFELASPRQAQEKEQAALAAARAVLTGGLDRR